MNNKTLSRIAALLRKAESTDNAHEADAYMAAAQRIATASSVDLAVARAHTAAKERRETPTQREVVIGEAGKKGLRTYVELFVAIAQANDVRCDVTRNSTRVFAYGFGADLDTTHALYASLIIQMVRASDEFIKSKAYAAEQVERWSARRRRWERKPVSAITARLSFQRAFAARISRRLSAAKEEAMDERLHQPAATGVALALRDKEVELADHYRAHSTARGTWRGSSASAGYSEHASRAGDKAGRRARLGGEKSVGGPATAIGARGAQR